MGENMDEITILIIEDDEDIRESVKILLENEGFHVIEADNGMDGLHQISEDTDLVWNTVLFRPWFTSFLFDG